MTTIFALEVELLYNKNPKPKWLGKRTFKNLYMKVEIIKLIRKYAIFSYDSAELKKMAKDITKRGSTGMHLLHALQASGPYRRSTLIKIGVREDEKRRLTKANRLTANELMDFCKKAAFLIKARALLGGTNKEFNKWFIERNAILGLPPSEYIKAADFNTLEKLLLSL